MFSLQGQGRPGERELRSMLATTMDVLGFMDLWRLSSYRYRVHSYLRGARSMSRIDYIFVSPLTIALMTGTQIHDILVPDHASVTLQIKDVMPRPQAILWWMPAYLAQDKAFKLMVAQAWGEYLEYNSQLEDQPSLFLGGRQGVFEGKDCGLCGCPQKRHCS